MRLAIGLSTLLFSLNASAVELTFEDIVQTVRKNRATSIEQLLPLLPQSFRSNYALIYKSRSLQEATYENPRIVLISSGAKLSCTFNGDAAEYGFDSLECYQYRDATRSFEFRQILFPTRENGQTETQVSDQNFTIDKNPIDCRYCHSTDPHPNWDENFNWQGAYGSRGTWATQGPDSEEGRFYKNFLSKLPTHPRYKWLAPESEPANTNLQFADLLGSLNAQRASRILESKLPLWQNFAWAFSALNCSLTNDQTALLKVVEIDPTSDLRLDSLFHHLRMTYSDWSTEVSGDAIRGTPPYEHLSGSSQLSTAVADQILRDRMPVSESPRNSEEICSSLVSYMVSSKTQ